MRKSFALLMPLVLLAAACGGEDNPAIEPEDSPKASQRSFAPDSFMADLKKKGKIVIGVKYDVPQFGALNPATTKPEGFEIDLGDIIARELGVEAEYVEALSANRLPFLLQDKVDLVISTMTINEERKKEIDFSNVYYIATQQLLVKKNSPIKEIADADAQKATVCSAKGSTSEKNLRAIAPNAQVNLQDGYSQCFQLLQSDQVQALSTDNVILLGLRKNDPDNFTITGKPFSKEPYGMGIKKGRVGFVDFVNEVLADVKEDGTWVKLYNKWVKPLSGDEGTPPPDTATAEAPTPAGAATTPAASSPAASPAGSPAAKP